MCDLAALSPAGGAIFAAGVAARAGEKRALSYDMGGTTAKICLIDDYQPHTARLFEVDRAARFLKGSGLPVRIPVIELVEIGAGGGSIARLDALGRLQVGPDSAACRLEVKPARRTVDICFDGKPDLAALRSALAAQPVEGAWVRLRWSVPEEERNDVDRAAMRELLAGAAGVQFEGRIVPVVRVRSGGIGRAGAMRDKVAVWASVVGARPEPLWACLDEFAAHEPQQIVDAALAELDAAAEVDAQRPADEATSDLKQLELAGDCLEVSSGAHA